MSDTTHDDHAPAHEPDDAGHGHAGHDEHGEHEAKLGSIDWAAWGAGVARRRGGARGRRLPVHRHDAVGRVSGCATGPNSVAAERLLDDLDHLHPGAIAALAAAGGGSFGTAEDDPDVRGARRAAGAPARRSRGVRAPGGDPGDRRRGRGLGVEHDALVPGRRGRRRREHRGDRPAHGGRADRARRRLCGGPRGPARGRGAGPAPGALGGGRRVALRRSLRSGRRTWAGAELADDASRFDDDWGGVADRLDRSDVPGLRRRTRNRASPDVSSPACRALRGRPRPPAARRGLRRAAHRDARVARPECRPPPIPPGPARPDPSA